jgi:5,10-methylenetetrahydromethanopterin reductase
VVDQQTRSLKFCIDLSHHAWTRKPVNRSVDSMQHAADQTIRMIEAADQAGLESAWVSEDPDGWDAFGVLNAAARSTSQIRLGTGVTNPYLRHPNLISMSASTLDRISGGRAFLGLGRGQPEWYRDTLGGTGSRSPLGQLETTIRLLRQWEQPPHRASSRTIVPVRDWARSVWPAQQRVPIYLAAIGPKALDLAARLADGLLIADFASIPFLERLIPEMRRKVASFGRDPNAFRFYVRTGIQLTDDPGPALRYRKTLMSVLAPLPGMSQHIVHPEHDVEAIVRNVDAAMGTRKTLKAGGNFNDIRMGADFNAAREAIPDGLIEDVSYVGSADHVHRKLGQLQDIGATHVFLSPPPQPDPGALVETLSKLGHSPGSSPD